METEQLGSACCDKTTGPGLGSAWGKAEPLRSAVAAWLAACPASPSLPSPLDKNESPKPSS